ncbi:SGNH/GDSL hydrolase family protein [Rhodococcus sp. IEGM 1408]|uniref:SGNH/GDSL hydrolase family protein n=1 Tax=Rhodococcus sp. IEGM 1408 TaxID=3082220 RepID=UPI002954E82F|nr:SGNH/GDSL hydrolase family protein [Rhodococcus sp. IEGM 1408]MDV7999643.1 SGNH/GDSL hydrolase family protein [Rhodococcus sp. IEGM 1408]
MHLSRLGLAARGAVTGTACAAATVLLSSLASAGAAQASPGIPVAPPATGSTVEQAGGSAQTLGQNIAGQVDGSGIGPSVYTGAGTGPAKYVALGDSYAAVGRVMPGSWGGGPVACVRTDDAYPTVVARELGVAAFVNASCAGAVTDDFWAPGRTGAPPQFEALDADTDLVSLTMGGNDVGFAAVIVACALRPNFAPGFLPAVDAVSGGLARGFDATTGCSDVIDRQAAEALETLDSRMDSVYGEIARRSPDARVVTVGYLSAIPDEQTVRNSPDCAPLMAATEAERDKMRGFQGAINRLVRDSAERNGATVVIPDEPGHSMCSPAETRWVDLTGLPTASVPVHPTSAGHAHVAERVVAALAGA